MYELYQTIALVVVLVFSAIVHEVMHGAVAEQLGDPTARNEGRLTLNPLVHLDPFGSILLPLMSLLASGRVYFAYAKPVPFNPSAFKNIRLGTALVAAAGPLSNLFLAIISATLLKFGLGNEILGPILRAGVITNISLFIFNLLPIPPLDGSKVFFSFASYRWHQLLFTYERYGIFILLFLIFSGLLTPIMTFCYAIFFFFFGFIF